MPSVAERTESSASSRDAVARGIHRRAIEAVIWGMPAVNFDRLYQSTVRAKGAWNQVVYWSRLADWKNQTLTPNPDVLYFFPFINTKEVGPVVLHIPPAGADGSLTGSVDDCWQTAIEDVGPAGVDKGKGGRYLIVPPGYKGHVPEGHIPMRPSTYQSYGILRSNPASGSAADVARAADYGKQIKVYPLSTAAKPPATVFVDVINVVYDNTIPYDLRFFQSLHRMIQIEPWLERDRAMIDLLKSIGIEKGKPFSPDESTKAILTAAAADAHAYLEARYEEVFEPPFDVSARWALPASKELVAGLATNFADPNSYPTDARGLAFSYAYFSAKHLGEGQFYLMTIKDKDGNRLNGAKTYRLHIPPNPPVRLYWSATVYDRATHAPIRDVKWPSRSSNTPGLQKNDDGSCDLYFAPRAPAGKQSNWVPTDASGKFEVLFRLYGPEMAFFEKKWTLPDIERVPHVWLTDATRPTRP
jgi:hypothetical protein